MQHPYPTLLPSAPPPPRRVRTFVFALITALCGLALPGVGQVVISQVYGAGGNTGAAYNRDYIELFNRGATTVTMTNWTIQYASAAGTTLTTSTAFSGSIAPGKYFLIQLTNSGTTGSALPTPDFTSVVNVDMSGTNGKVALASSSTGVSPLTATAGSAAPNSANVVDFVGFGTASQSEGSSPAPAPSATNAIFRASNGCTDTNVNSADFAAAAASPRNSSTTAAPCAGTNTITLGSISPTSYCVTSGAGTAISIPFTSTGTGFTASTTYTAQLSDASGSFASPTNLANPTGGVAGAYTINTTIPAGTAAGSGYKVQVVSGVAPASPVTSGSSANLTISLAPSNYAVSVTGTTPQTFANNGSGSALTAAPTSVTPSGASTGMTYQWKYGTAPGGPYTNIGGATNATYTPQGADFGGGAANTYYLAVDATSSASCASITRTSSDITITTTAPAPAITVRQGSTGGTIYTSGGGAYSGFANTAMGATSSAVTFFIMNTGTATLNLGTLTPSGDFAISSAPGSSSIVAGGNTSFQVTFSPTATGTRTGSISIASNDPATPYVLNLSAVGLPSAASDVIFNTGFTYNTTGIDYASKQGASVTSTLNTASEAIYSVTVRDGGAGLNDADALPTILNSLTFSSVQGIGSIRAAALFNGNTKVSADANTTIGASTIAFTNLAFSVADNTSQNLTLRVTFNLTVTDAQQLRVSLTNANVTTTGTSSTFSNFTALNSTTTAGSNEINVIATKLRYSTAPPATAGVNVDLTVAVEATDANNNRDTDFRSGSAPSVTLTRGAGTGTFSSVLNPSLTKTLVSGLATWTDLRYNTVENGVTLLTTNTGGLANASASSNFIAFAGILWDGGAGTTSWFDANNWSTNTLPTASDDVRLDNSAVSGSYTVTVPNANARAKSLQVGYGGNANTITVNINSAATSSDILTVGGGTLPALAIAQGGIVQNTITGASSSGLTFSATTDTWTMTENAQYIQNTTRAFPNITFGRTTFAATSTFEIAAPASTNWANGGIGRIKKYGNLVTNNSATFTLASGLNTTDSLIVDGNWDHSGALVRFVNSSTDQIRVRVKGNLTVGTGGIVHAAEGGGNSFTELIVEGNITTTSTGAVAGTGSGSTGRVVVGGSFTGTYAAGAANDDLVFSAVGGNTTPSTLTLTTGGGSISVRRLTINKSVLLGSAVSPTTSTTVSATGTLDFNGFNIAGGGSFSQASGATLKITDAVGISASGATGNVQNSGSRSFSTTGIFWYTGTSTANPTGVSQVTGTGLPTSTTAKTVILDNPNTISPTAITNFSSTGKLDIRRGTVAETAAIYFETGTVSAANLTMSGGTYQIKRLDAVTLPIFDTQISSVSTLTGGTIELSGAGNQSLRGGRSYVGLSFGNSGTKTLTSGISGANSVSGGVTITGDALVDLTRTTSTLNSSVGLEGAGTLNMSGTGLARLKISATGTRPGLTGVYNLTGGVIEFTNTSATVQTIRGNDSIDPARTYYNVEVTGTNVAASSGNFAIASGGTFTIKTGGNFDISTQAITGAGSFVMETGTTLQYASPNGITASATGTSAGNIRVTGTRTYVSNATYVVRGTGNSVTGDGLPGSVLNLTLNKGAVGNEVALSSAVTITGALTFTEGLLALQNASVTIAPGATIMGASSTKYVRTSTSPTATGGLVQRVPASATDVVFPVGTSSYTPARLQLTMASTADDFKVRVFDGVYTNGTSGTVVSTHVVNRTWDISEALAGGSDAAVTLQWNATDANITFNRFLCGLSHYLGGGIWDHKLRGWAPATDLGGGVYERNRAGFTSFSPFAVEDGSMILPVELIEFDAKPVANQVQLTWATASETDNDRFEVLRSADGRKFTAIGSVRGAGSSVTRRDYEFKDVAPLAGTAYYRLRQIDRSGREQMSAVRNVTLKGAAPVLVLYPNPASDRVMVMSNALTGATLRVVDALGRVVLEQRPSTAEATTELSIQTLPAGTYRLMLVPVAGPTLIQPLVKTNN